MFNKCSIRSVDSVSGVARLFHLVKRSSISPLWRKIIRHRLVTGYSL
ncbi:hypothetical protein [Nitrosomonas sp. Nm132]|nr:hypothetical protein [Nitrosomonas sp. Nm132]